MPVRKPNRSFRRSGLQALAAIGGVVAVTAIVEAALIPGLVIGAAAVVTPRLLPGRPARRIRRAPVRADLAPRAGRLGTAGALVKRPIDLSLLRQLRLKEATLKTVSFRVIMTTFDFGFNYVILGELVTAAGLSTISIVAGPFFYFLHETGWTYIRPLLPAGAPKPAVDAKTDYEFFGYRMSHALAKTITYRIFATASEFGTNYVVVQDVVTAAWLSAFGFFVGPFIYFAHERLWERLQADEHPEGAARETPRLTARPTIELRPI